MPLSGLPDEWAVDSNVMKIASVLVSVAAILGLLYVGQGVLMPLAIAFLVSFALSPLVRALVRRRVPRPLAASLVMLALLLALAGLTLLILSQLSTLSAELPTYQATMRDKIDALAQQTSRPGMFDGLLRTIDALREEMGQAMADESENAPMRVEIVPDATAPLRTAALWVGPILAPLATFGIVIVLIFLTLLDQGNLRDRFLRLLGGDLHRSTDAMEEAGLRISRYLIMQVVVNTSYAVPMAIGLCLIGVPGFALWGIIAGVMRFLPYVGPILSAMFPIAMAFAVDPGWQMVVLVIALIITLELISNNIVEPILYGTSTGLTALSLITAATFWTALWGPAGLVLSTPLTVCLLVIGRNIPQLRIFETLLGSAPALDTASRIYQRLLARDVDDALDLAEQRIETSSLDAFYADEGLSVLQRVTPRGEANARPEHRLRVMEGMERLLADLRADHPPPASVGLPRVACLGGRWEADGLSCQMLSHVLTLAGYPTRDRSAGHIDDIDLEGIDVVFMTYFNPSPARSASALCRKVRERRPDIRIVLALWSVDGESDLAKLAGEWNADHIVTSIDEALRTAVAILSPDAVPPGVPRPDDDEDRVATIQRTRVLDDHLRDELDGISRRAAEVFRTAASLVTIIDRTQEFVVGQSGDLAGLSRVEGDGPMHMPREAAVCNHVIARNDLLVIEDARRDPLFRDQPMLSTWSARFYAGAPLRTEAGHVIGALCLIDPDPYEMGINEQILLREMADEVVRLIEHGSSQTDALG